MWPSAKTSWMLTFGDFYIDYSGSDKKDSFTYSKASHYKHFSKVDFAEAVSLGLQPGTQDADLSEAEFGKAANWYETVNLGGGSDKLNINKKIDSTLLSVYANEGNDAYKISSKVGKGKSLITLSDSLGKDKVKLTGKGWKFIDSETSDGVLYVTVGVGKAKLMIDGVDEVKVSGKTYGLDDMVGMKKGKKF